MIVNNKIVSVYYNILIILVTYILYYIHSNNMLLLSIKFITIYGVLLNLLILIFYYIRYKSIKSIYFVFQFLSLSFLYGQLFVRYVLNIKFTNMFDLSTLVDLKTMIIAVFLIIFCQLFMNLGYVSFYKKTSITIDDNKEDNRIFLRMGLILLVISLIPAIVDYYNNFVSCMKYGYRGKGLVITYGVNSVFSKFVPFFYISILCLLIGNKKNKKLTRIILYFGIIFYGTQMLFGNRGIPLLMVICLMWFYHYFICKFKFKTLLLLFILSIILISILNVIRENRGSGFGEWISNSGELLIENLTNRNPIFDINYEIGTTIYPITYTLTYIPNRTGYKLGRNYLYSILSIFRLNTSSSSNNSFTTKMNIAIEVTEKIGVPFGGSFIQEAYANFGWLCVIFMFLLGFVLSKIDFMLNNNMTSISCILITYFLTSLLWTIRNTMSTLPRELAWYVLTSYILYYLIKKRSEESNER